MDTIVNVLLSALGVIITGLASFLVTKLTTWINSKISDQKTANYLTTVSTLTVDAVKEVYQTYVQSIKASGSFDAEAQKTALDMCINKITSKLAPDIVEYITKNFGDCKEYLTGLIESTLYTLKNGK